MREPAPTVCGPVLPAAAAIATARRLPARPATASSTARHSGVSFYKTQVFLNHGDRNRTRDDPFARGGARPLDRAGAGARRGPDQRPSPSHTIRSHRLSAMPGQDALHECMSRADAQGGGFEHKSQSLRVVDRSYAAFDRLRLSFETREGILKHRQPPQCRMAGGERSDGPRAAIDSHAPDLEAQSLQPRRRMAYNAHDIDDGVRSGLLVLEQLDADAGPAASGCSAGCAPGVDRPPRAVRDRDASCRNRVYDVIDTTRAPRVRHRASSPSRCAPPLVRYGQRRRRRVQRFLRAPIATASAKVVANHQSAREITARAVRSVPADPGDACASSPAAAYRVVADYVAGMTDRFALQEHAKLTGRRIDWPTLHPRAADWGAPEQKSPASAGARVWRVPQFASSRQEMRRVVPGGC